MSDINLLLFGCAVTFIGAAGAYTYMRECFTEGEKEPKPEAGSERTENRDVRNVA